MAKEIDRAVGMDLKLEANLTEPIQNVTDTLVSAATFVGKVLGPAVESAGAIVGDQFRYWRATNIERLRIKWRQKRRARGASEDAIRHLPFGIGIQFIEAASQEDDDEIQELWAGLLDAGTDPKSDVNVRRVHLEILKSLSAVEARILLFLWRARSTSRKSLDLNSLRMSSLDDRAIALQNLKRQECIRLKLDKSQMATVKQIRSVLAPGKDVSKEKFTAIIASLALLIENASGSRDDIHLGLNRFNNKTEVFPELHFELTNLGADLMKICERADQKKT